MKIYLVQGSSGMHDDHMTWIVKAFFKKDDAESLVKKCQEEADRIEKEISELSNKYLSYPKDKFMSSLQNPNKYWDEYTEITQSNKADPNFEYGEGCGYYTEEIEVEGELPKSETEN